MDFALTIPGDASDFWCEWPGVSLGFNNGHWRLEASCDDGFEALVAALDAVGDEETGWIAAYSEVRIERLRQPISLSHHECELDDLVELEIEIPLEEGSLEGDWHLCCDGCHIDADAFGDTLTITIPLSRTACYDNTPFEIHPIDAERDIILLDDEVIGRVWKERDDESPYNQLDGLVNTTAHPYLFHPVWPAVDSGAIDIESFLQETLQVDTWHELEEEFQADYLGINETDVGILLAGLAHALEDMGGDVYAEELEAMWEADGEADVEMTEAEEVGELGHVQHLLASALFTGSRVARAIVAKQGIDTALVHELGREDCGRLVEASVTSKMAYRRISGDDRFAGIYSFDVGTNRHLETAFGEIVDMVEWDQLHPDSVWSWACWAFDLGVKYQIARVGSDGLTAWAEGETEHIIESPHDDMD